MLDILKQVLYFLRQNFRILLPLLLLFTALSLGIERWLWTPVEQELAINQVGGEASTLVLGTMARYLFAAFLLNILFQLCLIIKLEGINGEREVGPGELVARLGSVFLPVLLGNLVIGLLSMVGLVFFVVPGVYVFLRFCMFDLIMVLERSSVGQGLRRSVAITQGITWQLFLFVALGIPAIMAVSLVLESIFAGSGSGSIILSTAIELTAAVAALFWLTVRYRYYLLQREAIEQGA